jgi:hypothetical protein
MQTVVVKPSTVLVTHPESASNDGYVLYLIRMSL